MSKILLDPEELDQKYDNFKFTFRAKATKNDDGVKVTLFAKSEVGEENGDVQTTITRPTFTQAFNDAIDKLNEKAEATE